MDSGIYAITSPSGRKYIGSARNLRARWRLHVLTLKAGTHHCAPLLRASRKYGLDALTFTVLEHCEIAQLIKKEQTYIDNYGFATLYNINPIAGSRLGAVNTPEHCQRISDAQRGKTLSAEHVAKLRAAKRPRLSMEQRAKISLAHKGRVKSATERANISAARNTSGYRFVTLDKSRGTWIARPPKPGGGYVTLGRFATPVEAANVITDYIKAQSGFPCT